VSVRRSATGVLRRVSRDASRPEPPRARLDVDERRQQLVTLGIRIFSARSYDEVSIDELARAAGISKGLLYHYFPTKRDFYVATVRAAAAQLLERTVTPEHMGPLDRLRAGLDGFLDYVVEHRTAYEALLRSGVGADAEVARILDETREAFGTRLIEKLEARGELVRVALRGWVGFVEAATMQWLGMTPAVPRVALREMLVQVLVGLVQTTAGALNGS
jgi:AcrR family transcriptional regulator